MKKKIKRKIFPTWIFVAGGKGHIPLLTMAALPQGYKEKCLGKFLGVDFNPFFYRRLADISWYDQREWRQYLNIIKKISPKLASWGERGKIYLPCHN